MSAQPKIDFLKVIQDKSREDRRATPQSLEQAISNAADAVPYLQLLTYKEQMIIREHIRDFLAQKFTPYMASGIPEVESVMKALWFSITGEGK